MSGELEYPLHRFPASPGKVTTLQVGRKLSRAGEEPFSEDYGEEEYYEVMERRGSSQSISRYSSCPHLAEKDGEGQEKETYEVTVDDIGTLPGAKRKNSQCITVQSPSPVLRRRINIDNLQYSDTPTPPSTPKSRRSFISSRDSLLSSPEKTHVGSNSGTPRLLHRGQICSSALSRESSLESPTEQSPGPHIKHVPLSVENVHMFDDISAHIDTGLRHNVQATPRKPDVRVHPETQVAHAPHASHQHEVSEMVDKCESWLQTLHIAKGDRIKSRSHIQLPPI